MRIFEDDLTSVKEDFRNGDIHKRVICSSAEPQRESIALKQQVSTTGGGCTPPWTGPLAATSAELVCFRIANPDPLSLDGFRMDPVLAWLRMDSGDDIVL